MRYNARSMSTWLRDVRLAARALRATPPFTCLVVLLLALGIAAATTLFSIANAVLFRPFPFADQTRLVVAGEDRLVPRSEVSYYDVEDWRVGTHVFEDLCAVSSAEWVWDLRTKAETLNGNGSVTINVMDDVVSRLETPWRSNFSLFVLFAGLTVVLAAAGLYALLAWSVAGQAREIGVRLVLGATPARIAATVVADGARMIASGAVTGLAAAALATRLMRSLLFDVSPLDPVALCAAPMLLVIVALAATALPAVRASRTEPSVCLRRD